MARVLDVTFRDLDDMIETWQEKSIEELFSDYGEAGFREIEREAFKVMLLASKIRPGIISLGGGTPCSDEAMAALNAKGTTVYLHTSVDKIMERLLIEDPAKRPLVRNLDEKSLRAYVEELLEKRRHYYEMAQHRFDSSLLETPAQVSDSALKFISQFNLVSHK